MPVKTLEQKRASYAFEKIKAVKGQSYEKDFSSLISKLPTLILTNGLGNTIAFLFSKGKEHHIKAINIIVEWLLKESDLKILSASKIDFNNPKNSIQEILDSIVLNTDIQQYTYAIEETLRLLNWLRRFSDAMLEKDESNQS